MRVFNGDAFLAEAADSILAQTFTDFEFGIIDDGSTVGQSSATEISKSKFNLTRVRAASPDPFK